MKYTNEQQRIINHDINSHALVSAVAGSGKTQTLIARIEYLLSQAIAPNKILVLMYNKSAQLDFVARLNKVLDAKNAQLVNVRTMHSLGNSFLKAFAKAGHINFDRVLKEYEIDNILLKIIKACQRDFKITKEVDSKRVESFKEYISLLKYELSSNSKKLETSEKRLFDKVFEMFSQECKKLKAITHDDMIYMPVKLFQKSQPSIDRASNMYSYIIIDEYQDINHAQQFFLKCLVGKNTYVMAVGDVDQTIYQWRGSTPYYMLEGFKKDFKKTSQYQLSYTFRYGDLISLMSNNIITNNKKRHDNLCITYPKIDRTTNISILDNSDKAVNKLKALINSGVKANNIAILVRKYNSTTAFELSCLYNDLPYNVVADKSIFSDNLFKAIYGYLILFNQGYGFKKHSQEEACEIVQAMFDYPSLYLKRDVKQKLATEIAKDISQAPNQIKKLVNVSDEIYKSKNILSIAQSWQTIFDSTKLKSAVNVIDFIFKTLNLKKVLDRVSGETYSSKSKIQMIDGIVTFAKSRNKSFSEFIELLHGLYSKSKQYTEVGDSSQIQIMSIHKAKGLEWDYVVVHDATEAGFFGENNSEVTDEVIEEERRLFYVAITRVKKHLFIVSSNDIHKLSSWYKMQNNSYPQALKCENSLRFLYEGNLVACENYLKDKQNSKLTSKNRIFDKYSKFTVIDS